MALDDETKHVLKTVGISVGVSLLVVGLYHHIVMGPIMDDVDNARQYIAKIKAPLAPLVEKAKAIELPNWLKKSDQ